jgi:hypothetical protein
MIMRKICKECANYDHKNLKHTKACGTCVTEHYQDGTESDPSNWRALPQTNADRIRAMSDEELAKVLNAFTDYFEECNRSSSDVDCKDCELYKVCSLHEGKALEWLKRPAEVE